MYGQTLVSLEYTLWSQPDDHCKEVLTLPALEGFSWGYRCHINFEFYLQHDCILFILFNFRLKCMYRAVHKNL